MGKHGVVIIELSGREASEARYIIGMALTKMAQPKKLKFIEKQQKGVLNSVYRKLWGEYRCKHCKQWVNKSGHADRGKNAKMDT